MGGSRVAYRCAELGFEPSLKTLKVLAFMEEADMSSEDRGYRRVGGRWRWRRSSAGVPLGVLASGAGAVPQGVKASLQLGVELLVARSGFALQLVGVELEVVALRICWFYWLCFPVVLGIGTSIMRK